MADRTKAGGSVELLAPAGNMSCGLTAFDCGADAVYVGLKRFNARERGENFSLDELARLTAYARGLGRKVYLTLNTLLKEWELEEAASLLREVSDIRPHAVLVQDLGVLRMIRRYFPCLAVHASTQMGTHNSAGVAVLASMGVERVILERQLTLAELRETVAKSPVEIEVFAHGALCCSLSGMCLLSSWMGGWSGNRGRCKQPCRRRFRGADGNGFFFSTRDLYTLDLLGELESIGVAALKIEGRLRSADYVQSVVSAYRLVLDTPPAERADVLKEARRGLAGALGRKWSHGFLDEDGAAHVLQYRTLGVSGLLCGEVTRVEADGFLFLLSRPVRIGDRLRVQPGTGDEGPAVTVRELRVGRRPVPAGRRGQECFVACAEDVPRDGRVYRTGGPEAQARDCDAPSVTVVDLSVNVSPSGVTVSVEGLVGPWIWQFAIEPARQRRLEPATVEEEFRKSVGTTLSADRVRVSVDGELFMAHRDLRHARQEFWRWAAEAVAAGRLRPSGEAGYERFLAERGGAPGKASYEVELVVRLFPGNRNPFKGALTARSVDDDGAADEFVLPEFCPEPELSALRSRVAELVAAQEGL